MGLRRGQRAAIGGEGSLAGRLSSETVGGTPMPGLDPSRASEAEAWARAWIANKFAPAADGSVAVDEREAEAVEVGGEGEDVAGAEIALGLEAAVLGGFE